MSRCGLIWCYQPFGGTHCLETLITVYKSTRCNNPGNHIVDYFSMLSERTVIQEAVQFHEVVPALIYVPFLTQVISLGAQEHTYVCIDCLVAADLYLVGEWLVI